MRPWGAQGFFLPSSYLRRSRFLPWRMLKQKQRRHQVWLRSKTFLFSLFAHFFQTVTNTLLFVLISCENNLMLLNFQKNQNKNSIFKLFVQIFFFGKKIFHDFLIGYWKTYFNILQANAKCWKLIHQNLFLEAKNKNFFLFQPDQLTSKQGVMQLLLQLRITSFLHMVQLLLHRIELTKMMKQWIKCLLRPQRNDKQSLWRL